MNGKIVRVVIDLSHTAVDQLFDYSVPEEWGILPEVGSRVIVPFGHRKAVGFVWEKTNTSEREELKPIIEVLDEEPLLTREQILLCDTIAEKYLSLRLDSLRLFLPPGMVVGTEKVWSLPKDSCQNYSERINSLTMSDETHKIILSSLEKAKQSPDYLIHGGEPELNRILALLASEGYLHTHWRSRTNKVRPKTEKVIRLNSEILEDLTPKQKQVVSWLESTSIPMEQWNLRTVCKETRVGVSVIRRLLENGVLRYEERRIYRIRDYIAVTDKTIPELTLEQKEAYSKITSDISQGRSNSYLLYGVTGSGKTEVYLRLLEDVIKRGKKGLFLVPEIALTPQTMERVQQRLGEKVAILHSRLSDGERYDQWWRIHRGEVDVVVGARSALFAPLRNIGLIILDEEHEYSYKQEEAPRYQTRDVARKYCQMHGATLLLGSATPSLESWLQVQQGTLECIRLTRRVAERPLPPIETVDMRTELKDKHFGVLSRRLREAILETLDREEQIILLLNRRGFSTFVLCRECGQVLRCQDCDVSLTFHQNPPLMKCHYCGMQNRPPDVCPHCRSRYIRFFGQGTQRLEEEVKAEYPNARVARMDLDTTGRKGAHEAIYKNLKEKKIDILIGTQMVAKGLDIPGVTLVGVVAADATLHIPDFRSAERTYQLLTQVAGRAGRGESSGRVILQTYNPEHYCIKAVVESEDEEFYQRELTSRQAAGYPPTIHMIRIGISGPVAKEVISDAEQMGAMFEQQLKERSDIELLGPVPASIERIKGKSRWQIILRGNDEKTLRDLVSDVLAKFRLAHPQTSNRYVPDVNPYSLF